MSDEELLKSLAREDPMAFLEFEKRFKEKIFFQVRRDLHSDYDEISKEIYQEVIIAIWKKSRANDRIDNLPGYVYKICKNKIRDRIKNIKRNTFSLENDQPNEGANIVENILTREEIKHIYAIIQKLKPIEREIIRLFFEEELTSREVGEMLNMNADAVKQRKKRVLDKIREALKNPGRQVTFVFRDRL